MCEKVTHYSDEDEEAMVIPLSKVAKQFNPVTEFPTLFPRTVPPKLLPLRNVNYQIDAKPESEWLYTCRTLAHKFGIQINDKLDTAIESGCMYAASNDKDCVVMFYVANRDKPDKPSIVTSCQLGNLAIYQKQTPLRNIEMIIKLVAAHSVWSVIDLADPYFNIKVE